MCRSGSAADTQNLASYVQLYLHQHQMELGGDVSVRTAARLAQQIVYNNKVRRGTCRAQGLVQGAGPLCCFQRLCEVFCCKLCACRIQHSLLWVCPWYQAF